MEVGSVSETSVRVHHSTWRHVPENGSFYSGYDVCIVTFVDRRSGVRLAVCADHDRPQKGHHCVVFPSSSSKGQSMLVSCVIVGGTACDVR
jgi:hypothetical protein